MPSIPRQNSNGTLGTVAVGVPLGTSSTTLMPAQTSVTTTTVTRSTRRGFLGSRQTSVSTHTTSTTVAVGPTTTDQSSAPSPPPSPPGPMVSASEMPPAPEPIVVPAEEDGTPQPAQRRTASFHSSVANSDEAARTPSEPRRLSVGHALRRAVSNLNMKSVEREFSHASLNEHMLSHSLTRSLARRDWRAVAVILFGWCSNLLCFLGLLLAFSLYACDLFGKHGENSEADWRALLISWAVSVFQRFLINEPMLILLSKGIPMLFTSELCANVCGETVVNLIDISVQAISTCVKAIRTG